MSTYIGTIYTRIYNMYVYYIHICVSAEVAEDDPFSHCYPSLSFSLSLYLSMSPL